MNQSGSSEQPRFSAFIGNLPYNAVPGDLETLFEGLSIVNVNLVRDKETDTFRGYAYVDFSTEADLNSALARDKTVVLDREVTIQLPKPKQSRTQNAPRRTTRDTRERPTFATELPTAPPFKAFIGNFSYDTTVEELTSFLEGLEVKDIKLIFDKETGQPKGHAYVEFNDQDSLKQVLTADNTELRGRTLKIYVATQTSRNDHNSFQNRRPQRSFGNRNRSNEDGNNAFSRSYNKRAQQSSQAETVLPETSASESRKEENGQSEQKEALPAIDKKDITIEPKNKDKPKKEDIFGTAKPRDEFEYQKRLQQTTGTAKSETVEKGARKNVPERKVSSRPSLPKETKATEKKEQEKKPVDENGFQTVTKRHIK